MVGRTVKSITRFATQRFVRTKWNIASPKKAVSRYLRDNSPAKLHIGCGRNILTGWLNSDFYPSERGVIHLDATRRFPLPDNCLDYVFSEHMIEHIEYESGLKMLKETHRVLKPKGKVRVSTPNLEFLIELYSKEKTDIQKAYIKWASERLIRNGEQSDTMVINNFVRAWGHLFIYDKKTLSRSLMIAGFEEIQSFDINKSNDLALADLEHDSRMPMGFLQLESLSLEARKPA